MDLNWREEYSVGVEEIDDQHKQFLKILRRLYDSLGKLLTGEILLRTLLEVRRYAEYHFVSEENLMLQSKYGARESHAAAHVKLLEDLKQHLKDIETRKENLSDLVKFMMDWFAHHTQTEDKAFGHWLIERLHQAKA
ncbi:MAG: bacteriohemerythrin [Spirochaetes bacterium]|nr:bacteriohemerythrin [Spirochaetota bacterium]